MLHLSSEDVDAVLDIEAVLDALETVYDDYARGDAAFTQRADIITPVPPSSVEDADLVPPVVHGFKTMSGAVRSMDATALRLNSDIIHWPTVEGARRRVKVPAAPGEQYTAFIQVFDTRTGRLLSIMPDGEIQRLCVGGTNALAADVLARPDATEVALLGAGWQAGAHVRAIDAVRDLDEIRVYSPHSRDAFAAEMNATDKIDTPVVAVPNPETACRGADVVFCTTNQRSPVFTADLLEPGMHLACVRDFEFDAGTYNAADHIVKHPTERFQPRNSFAGTDTSERLPQLGGGYLPDHPQSEELDVDWSRVTEFADVRAAGFEREPDDVTVFVPHMNGLQFTGVGKRIYELAVDHGVGEKHDSHDWAQPHHP